jgi:hypothetical protein
MNRAGAQFELAGDGALTEPELEAALKQNERLLAISRSPPHGSEIKVASHQRDDAPPNEGLWCAILPGESGRSQQFARAEALVGHLSSGSRTKHEATDNPCDIRAGWAVSGDRTKPASAASLDAP